MANLRVKIENVEVRGVVEKEGYEDDEGKKKPSFLVVRIDDAAGDRHELLDYDLENAPLYERGKFYDFTVDVDYGYSSKKKTKWVNFKVKSLSKRA